MNGGSGATNPGYHAGEEGKDGQVIMAIMVAMIIDKHILNRGFSADAKITYLVAAHLCCCQGD